MALVRVWGAKVLILKPLDLIQPYRLEMGTKLVNSRGKSLYEFWGSRIAEQLNDDLEGHPDPTVAHWYMRVRCRRFVGEDDGYDDGDDGNPEPPL